MLTRSGRGCPFNEWRMFPYTEAGNNHMTITKHVDADTDISPHRFFVVLVDVRELLKGRSQFYNICPLTTQHYRVSRRGLCFSS